MVRSSRKKKQPECKLFLHNLGHIGGCAEPRRLRMPKKVRILPPISARFVRSRDFRPYSAKTDENPARGACAEKRMSFRRLPRRHLSVVCWRSRKTDEIV
jgi:hypothetical protein